MESVPFHSTSMHFVKECINMFDNHRQVTTERVCVDTKAERWYPVANMSITNLVNVWEYSETRKHFSVMFSIPMPELVVFPKAGIVVFKD